MGPKQTPPRYEDRWVRSKTSGSPAGRVRSVCVISMAPVATSIGSPTHGVLLQGRAAGPNSTRSGRSAGGRSISGTPSAPVNRLPSTPAFATPAPAPNSPPYIMPSRAAALISSRLKPFCRPVAIFRGWATARSIDTDSMPPNAAATSVPAAISATVVETATPMVRPNSISASVARAAAPAAMPAVKNASAMPPTMTAASMPICVHSLVMASSMASANLSSAFAISRDDPARSLSQPVSLPLA